MRPGGVIFPVCVFIEREQVYMKLIFPLAAAIFMAVIGTGKVYAQAPVFREKTDSVYQALAQHNAALLLPLLDDSCRISNLPRGMNARLIPAILEKYPALSGYRLVGTEADAAGVCVTMELQYAGGKTGNPTYHVNSKGLIDELAIIKNASVSSGAEKSAVRVVEAPDTLSIPFAFQKGLLYVKAAVDGREGWFLLDTGSPEMILNRAYFSDSLMPVPGDNSYTGINGRMEDVMVRRMRHFQLGAFTLRNFAAMVMPDANEAFADGLPVLGSIGYNTIRDFEVCFRLQQGNLLLIKTDSAGNYASGEIQLPPVKQMASFEMRRHIPVVVMTVGEHSLRMGIDCGAANNVLFMAKKELVMPWMEQWDEVSLIGQEGVSNMVERAYLKLATIGTLPFKNMLTIVTDNNMQYNAATDKTALDGLLGIEFLKCYTTSINFRKKQVYFR